MHYRLVYVATGIISIVLTGFCTLTLSYHENKKILISVLSSLPLVIVSGFRYGIGSDYFNYVGLLQKFNYYSWYRVAKYNSEPIFSLFAKLITVISDNYQVFFLITSLIYLFSLFFSIYRDSDIPTLSVFLLLAFTYYLSSFNTVREHLACCILMLSLYYVNNRKPILFFSCVTIAGLIHNSAFLFFAAYFIRFLKLTPKLVGIITILVLFFRELISRVIQPLLGTTRYARYLIETTNAGINTYLGVVIQLTILIFGCYYFKNCEIKTNVGASNNTADKTDANNGIVVHNNNMFGTLFGCQAIAFWISLFATQIPRIHRVRWIFSYPTIILIPFIIHRIPTRKEKIVVTIVLVFVVCIYYYIVIHVVGSFGVLPYKMIKMI